MYYGRGTAFFRYGPSCSTVKIERRVGESDIRTSGDDDSTDTVSPRVTWLRITVRHTRQHVTFFVWSARRSHLHCSRTFYINNAIFTLTFKNHLNSMYTHRFSEKSSQNRFFSNLKPLQHLVGGSAKSVGVLISGRKVNKKSINETDYTCAENFLVITYR